MKRRLTLLTLLVLSSMVLPEALRVQANDEPSRPNQSGKQKVKDESSAKYRGGDEWFGRGYELHQSDRYPEAIEAFKHSVELGYRQATAMYNIACGYSLMNDKELAFEWLKRALASGFSRQDLLREDSDLDPLRSDARFKQIVASFAGDRDKHGYRKPDRLEQAGMDFERLDREASQDGPAWYKLGSLLLRLRDFDRSIISLNKAVTFLDAKGASAMYNLACAYALKGDREAGLEWLEKSINAGFDEKDKIENDPDIASLRGDARFKRIEQLSRTLSLSQFYKDSFNGSLYSKRQWAPAIELYETLLKSEPTNGRAWFNLGYALHYSREHAKAIEAFERAIQFGYRKPVSMYNIACAYSMLDQRDMAFQWLDRALEAGFDTDSYVESDRDLDNLKSDPRFKRFQIRARGL